MRGCAKNSKQHGLVSPLVSPWFRHLGCMAVPRILSKLLGFTLGFDLVSRSWVRGCAKNCNQNRLVSSLVSPWFRHLGCVAARSKRNCLVSPLVSPSWVPFFCLFCFVLKRDYGCPNAWNSTFNNCTKQIDIFTYSLKCKEVKAINLSSLLRRRISGD